MVHDLPHYEMEFSKERFQLILETQGSFPLLSSLIIILCVSNNSSIEDSTEDLVALMSHDSEDSKHSKET